MPTCVYVLQADVFEDTKNLIRSAVDGFNVCVFAYGQTGSGEQHVTHVSHISHT